MTIHELTCQQKDFLSASGKVVLCACPGSGKTYVVANKLLNYVQRWDRPHQGVAVLSFTNVASQEVERQVKEQMPNGFEITYPHYVGTLDSFINRFILSRFGHLIMPGFQRPKITVRYRYNEGEFQWMRDCHVSGCVQNIHEFRWGIDGKLYGSRQPRECKASNSKNLPCYRYKTLSMKKGVVFQSEAAALACRLLAEFGQVSEAIATRFPIILLDEAQDTSFEQMAVIDKICENGVESVFLVGDPDQAIYEWRDADPECFVAKMHHHEWNTLFLTRNFRSSQLICNATKAFSKTIENKSPNVAEGEYAKYEQKPVLLLYDGEFDDIRENVIQRFLDLCGEHKIDITPEHVAIVTRSRIHKDTNIEGLWKSNEVYWFALATYEWYLGSRKRAYELCEKALYSMCIGDLLGISVSIDADIELKMPYELWRSKVIAVLTSLPDVTLPLGTWVDKMKETLSKILPDQQLDVRSDCTIDRVIRIKRSDTRVPEFKKIPLNRFIEKKCCFDYTLSSVHGIKGETYDALLLLVEHCSGRTLNPKFLDTGKLDDELMRIAYVAMTRPRKLLVVAMPDCLEEYNRFTEENWQFEKISGRDLVEKV